MVEVITVCEINYMCTGCISLHALSQCTSVGIQAINIILCNHSDNTCSFKCTVLNYEHKYYSLDLLFFYGQGTKKFIFPACPLHLPIGACEGLSPIARHQNPLAWGYWTWSTSLYAVWDIKFNFNLWLTLLFMLVSSAGVRVSAFPITGTMLTLSWSCFINSISRGLRLKAIIQTKLTACLTNRQFNHLLPTNTPACKDGRVWGSYTVEFWFVKPPRNNMVCEIGGNKLLYKTDEWSKSNWNINGR